jgi:hypothetical protein
MALRIVIMKVPTKIYITSEVPEDDLPSSENIVSCAQSDCPNTFKEGYNNRKLLNGNRNAADDLGCTVSDLPRDQALSHRQCSLLPENQGLGINSATVY